MQKYSCENIVYSSFSKHAKSSLINYKMMKGAFVLLILACCMSFSSSCPSNTYVSCGTEGGKCNIPAGPYRGYVSYGVDGKYTFIPFSKSSSDTLSMDCDNDFGDIYPGRRKYCCYRSIDIGFDEVSYYEDYAKTREGGSWDMPFTTPMTMKYGANNKHVYRVIADANVPCTNAFFGDVVPAVTKYCQLSNYMPPTISSTNWYHCGNEGGNCDLQDSNPHWVRYGEGSSFYYRLVSSSNSNGNTIGCTNDIFDDPKYGTRKYCWRSDPEFVQ